LFSNTIGSDARKKDIARDLVASKPAVSSQVVNECVSVCLRKLSFSREQAYNFAKAVMERTEVLSVDGPHYREGRNARNPSPVVALGRAHHRIGIACGLRDAVPGRPAAQSSLRQSPAHRQSICDLNQRTTVMRKNLSQAVLGWVDLVQAP
jgi:hypothetical protein